MFTRRHAPDIETGSTPSHTSHLDGSSMSATRWHTTSPSTHQGRISCSPMPKEGRSTTTDFAGDTGTQPSKHP